MSKTLVSELLKKLDRETRAKMILSELNDYVNFKESIAAVIKYLKEITGCEAIGIRLFNGKDYPIFAYEGLPVSYGCQDSRSCFSNPGINHFKLPYDEVWSTMCLCKDVIQGKGDGNLPFFTSQGSFFTNDFLGIVIKKDMDCAKYDFNSMALIRIIFKNNCIGLIQLFSNTTKFNLDVILFLEMIGNYIGVAVYNSMVYSKMKEAYDSLNQLIPICANCKKVNTENENWISIEDYLIELTGAEFTHEICPDCMEKLYPSVFARIKEKYGTSTA